MTLDYQFEIDEFIDGELFHGDILLINGEVKFFMAGQCSFALSCFFEGKPVGSIPVNDPTLFKKLKDFFVQALMVLNPRSGAYHMEVFRDRKTGELVFLEVGARTGGALITKVYEKIYGFNVEEVNYKIQMGLCDDFSYEDPHIYAGFLNFPTINGVLTQIVDLPPMEIEYQFINFFREQSIACQAKNLLDISSSILFWDESFERVAETFERLKNHTPVIYNDNLEFILKQNELCLRPAETWHYSPLRRAAA
jgi:hypothetical protein